MSIIQEQPMNEPTPNLENKRNKGGRPKKDSADRKDNFVKVSFDTLNFRKLKRRSRRTGASLSSIVYELTVNGKILEPLSQETMDCIRKIAGMANNLNQLAHEAHVMGFAEVADRNKELAERINEELTILSRLR